MNVCSLDLCALQFDWGSRIAEHKRNRVNEGQQAFKAHLKLSWDLGNGIYGAHN